MDAEALAMLGSAITVVVKGQVAINTMLATRCSIEDAKCAAEYAFNSLGAEEPTVDNYLEMNNIAFNKVTSDREVKSVYGSETT